MNIILIPTYNERENVRALIPRVFSYCPDVKVIVVDDNSPDGTGEEIKKMSLSFPNLALMSRSKKDGLGNAYKDAILYCLKNENFEKLATMDADGSHDPKYLPELFKKSETYDLVIGSRYVKDGGVKNWSVLRRFLSRFGNYYARIVTGINIHDLTAGFIATDKKILEKIDFGGLKANGYSYQIEFKFRCLASGPNVSFFEMPIVFTERRQGKSKMSRNIIIEAIKVPWTLRKKH
ncbi:MAG: polyprenol monophosphomannose synthase [Patescibacteria group bacterium]